MKPGSAIYTALLSAEYTFCAGSMLKGAVIIHVADVSAMITRHDSLLRFLVVLAKESFPSCQGERTNSGSFSGLASALSGGAGREPGILTRQSRGGGRVGVSRDLPVGVLSGVPRDRVPRPPRGGRRPVGGRPGRAGSPCPVSSRAVSVPVSVSVSP
jgi:hypothetical protein